MNPRRLWGAALALPAALCLGLSASAAAPRADYAAVALNVLAPGESGDLGLTDPHATDQIRLYDGLTPLFDKLGPRELRRFFKAAPLGLAGEKPSRREATGRKGLRILRDRWGVAHVFGRTSADVMYGAGWVTAEDRGVLLSLLRYPGRIAAIDVPGFDPFSIVGSARHFVPSGQTESFLDAQAQVLRRRGARGRRLLADLDAYVAGINAWFGRAGVPTAPWTRRDVFAITALLVARFGAGGGDETRASQLLSALEQRLGPERGRSVWDDLRERDDPEAPVAVDGRFPYDAPAGGEAGAVVIDDGSFKPALGGPSASSAHAAMSNAILVSRRRSANGHPILVAGPQVGYFYPELLLELDLHGAGIDARGASVPGLSFVLLLGRGKDYGWSLTSSGGDVVDQFVETLCGDDVHYLYKGSCEEMGVFDAGELQGPGEGPAQPVVLRTTVHGPVVGYATVGGTRVAISSMRSTRGREIVSALPFQDLMRNRVRSARGFVRTMTGLEAALNALYVDDRDIAQFTGGRLPLRAPGTVSGLPTPGTGEFEWRGFLPGLRHANGINPRSGVLVNWNNKPARGMSAADDQWSYGSVQRVDLLRDAIQRRRVHTPASVVAAMNRAATQDLRAIEVLPAIEAVLGSSTAPTNRAAQMLKVLVAWRASGATRLDRDLDGRIDHPGAAIMDAAWPRIVQAVMSPVLGPLVGRLARIEAMDDPPGPGGSAYIEGWYGYVDKDLRALLGRPVAGAFRNRFCGSGDLVACRASLWAALHAAGDELASTQGPEPAGWRADARAERIQFLGFLPMSMRWTNRPTFQQVLSFTGHRPR